MAQTPKPGDKGDQRPAPPPTFDLSLAIRRPPGAVFALLADIQDFEPIPRSAVVRMVKEPAGPTAPGTRWHERVRVARGCWLRVENVVSEVEEPKRLGIDFDAKFFSGHLTYEIEPTAGGSVLHNREILRSHPLLRWLSPLIERRLRRRMIERLEDMRTILEGSPE